MRRSPLIVLLTACLLPTLPTGSAWAQPSVRELKAALKADAEQLDTALAELTGHLDRRLAKTLLDAAPALRPRVAEWSRLPEAPDVYARLVSCLASAEDKALADLVRRAEKGKPVETAFLALDALAAASSEAAAGQADDTLRKVLLSSKEERLRVLACRRLALRPRRPVIEALIEALDELELEGPARDRLTAEIQTALTRLTGESLPIAQDWRNWWEPRAKDWTPPAPQPASEDGKGKSGDGTTVRGRMEQERPADMQTLLRLPQSELLVVEGRSDKVERILKSLDLPHQTIPRDGLAKAKLDPEAMVLILNCGSTQRLSDADIARIREFVARGGFVFSSDWELGHTLAPAFKNAVTYLGEAPRGDDKQVKIQAHRGALGHPLLRDVFPLNPFEPQDFAWNFEQRSHLVKETPTLELLIEAPENQPLGSTTVAFCFGYTAHGGGQPVPSEAIRRAKVKGGVVLHVLSHFKDQRSKDGDGFALQQLLLNFILEKQALRLRLQRKG